MQYHTCLLQVLKFRILTSKRALDLFSKLNTLVHLYVGGLYSFAVEKISKEQLSLGIVQSCSVLLFLNDEVGVCLG